MLISFIEWHENYAATQDALQVIQFCIACKR